MEGSGIVRRIDELGRIVIPKELRKTLRIKVGDEMEIVSSCGNVVLKKYSGYESVKDEVRAVAKVLAEYLEADVVVMSSTEVVVSEGKNKKHYQDALIGDSFQRIIAARHAIVIQGDELKGVFSIDVIGRDWLAFEPIILNGDSLGGIAILTSVLPANEMRAFLKFAAELIATSLE